MTDKRKPDQNYFCPGLLNLVESMGVEPMTSCLQGRRSSQLS